MRRAPICCAASDRQKTPQQATHVRSRWSPTMASGAFSSGGFAKFPSELDGSPWLVASRLRNYADLEGMMPEQATIKRARADKRAGKAPTTQAGEFVREEMHHIREGRHGARSAKQAIAIGLSKARRAGVKLSPPPRGSKPKTRQSAKYASRAATRRARPSRRRSRVRHMAARKAARTRQWRRTSRRRRAAA